MSMEDLQGAMPFMQFSAGMQQVNNMSFNGPQTGMQNGMQAMQAPASGMMLQQNMQDMQPMPSGMPQNNALLQNFLQNGGMLPQNNMTAMPGLSGSSQTSPAAMAPNLWQRQPQSCVVKNTFLHVGEEKEVASSPLNACRRERSEPPGPRKRYASSEGSTGSDDPAFSQQCGLESGRQVTEPATKSCTGQFVLIPSQNSIKAKGPEQIGNMNELLQMSFDQLPKQFPGMQQHQNELELLLQGQQPPQQTGNVSPAPSPDDKAQKSFFNEDQDNTDDEDCIGQNPFLKALPFEPGATARNEGQMNGNNAAAMLWMTETLQGMQQPPRQPGRSQRTSKKAPLPGAGVDKMSMPASAGRISKGQNESSPSSEELGNGGRVILPKPVEDEKRMAEAERKKRAVDPYSWDAGVVTVMVRQLPRQFTQRMFLQEVIRRGFEGLFDFLYLPYDFKKGINVGYGFVNFTEPEYALRFRDSLDGQYLDKYMRMKSKAIRVHPAQVQGYEANYRHFAHTKTGQKQDPAFSPLFFPVPRDVELADMLNQMPNAPTKDIPENSAPQGMRSSGSSMPSMFSMPAQESVIGVPSSREPQQRDQSWELPVHQGQGHQDLDQSALPQMQAPNQMSILTLADQAVQIEEQINQLQQLQQLTLAQLEGQTTCLQNSNPLGNLDRLQNLRGAGSQLLSMAGGKVPAQQMQQPQRQQPKRNFQDQGPRQQPQMPQMQQQQLAAMLPVQKMPQMNMAAVPAAQGMMGLMMPVAWMQEGSTDLRSNFNQFHPGVTYRWAAQEPDGSADQL